MCKLVVGRPVRLFGLVLFDEASETLGILGLNLGPILDQVCHRVFQKVDAIGGVLGQLGVLVPQLHSPAHVEVVMVLDDDNDGGTSADHMHRHKSFRKALSASFAFNVSFETFFFYLVTLVTNCLICDCGGHTKLFVRSLLNDDLDLDHVRSPFLRLVGFKLSLTPLWLGLIIADWPETEKVSIS